MSENTVQTENVQRGHGKRCRTTRVNRIPLSGTRLKMEIREEDKDPNFHYAWINDTGGLLHDAAQAGYENVRCSEIPSWGVRNIDSANSTDSLVSMPVGGGVIAYLMKQPMEYYLEDRAAMDQIVDDREASMKRQLNSREDGQYGKVSISRDR